MHLSLPADPHTRVCTCTLPMIYSGAGTLFLLGIRDILCLLELVCTCLLHTPCTRRHPSPCGLHHTPYTLASPHHTGTEASAQALSASCRRIRPRGPGGTGIPPPSNRAFGVEKVERAPPTFPRMIIADRTWDNFRAISRNSDRCQLLGRRAPLGCRRSRRLRMLVAQQGWPAHSRRCPIRCFRSLPGPIRAGTSRRCHCQSCPQLKQWH